MQLTDEQAKIARQWLDNGMKLGEFQKRLETEFGISLTYMEVRFLLDDLKLVPKDPEPEPEPEKPAEPEAAEESEALPADGQVSLTVDVVTQPGTLVSGKVTFSDGQRATWFVDTMGRPGLAPEKEGYRPSRQDIEQFQMALERELRRTGL